MSGGVNRKNKFRKEANLLVSQVAESLATLNSSSVKHAKLADNQQHQMAELMRRKQKVIHHRHDANQEMKQQQWGGWIRSLRD